MIMLTKTVFDQVTINKFTKPVRTFPVRKNVSPLKLAPSKMNGEKT